MTVLLCTYQYGVPMKESLLCNVLLFFADTPKSATSKKARTKGGCERAFQKVGEREKYQSLFKTNRRTWAVKAECMRNPVAIRLHYIDFLCVKDVTWRP